MVLCSFACAVGLVLASVAGGLFVVALAALANYLIRTLCLAPGRLILAIKTIGHHADMVVAHAHQPWTVQAGAQKVGPMKAAA